jgi:hypothetical protein
MCAITASAALDRPSGINLSCMILNRATKVQPSTASGGVVREQHLLVASSSAGNRGDKHGRGLGGTPHGQP